MKFLKKGVFVLILPLLFLSAQIEMSKAYSFPNFDVNLGSKGVIKETKKG